VLECTLSIVGYLDVRITWKLQKLLKKCSATRSVAELGAAVRFSK
jgi:hypothetical protein